MDDYTYEPPIGSTSSSASDLDLDTVIFDLDTQLDDLSCKADSIDYLVAIGSGLVCALLDPLWMIELEHDEDEEWTRDQIREVVVKSAQLVGYPDNDVKGAVAYIASAFMPARPGMPDLGTGPGPLDRDFGAQPGMAGLAFSLLTQFTGRVYGTDVEGKFASVKMPKDNQHYLGRNTTEKIVNATLIWFLHVVEAMADPDYVTTMPNLTESIPGPIRSIAEKLSQVPFFQRIRVGDQSLQELLDALLDGSLLEGAVESNWFLRNARRLDLCDNLDLQGELAKQAVPVVANECMVRTFYFLHHLATEAEQENASSIENFKRIAWTSVSPAESPTLSRMLTVATGVFTTAEAVKPSSTYANKQWITVVAGGIRFCVALGQETSWGLERRRVREIRNLYSGIDANTYTKRDNDVYVHVEERLTELTQEKLGLTVDQTEVLYNLERLKTMNDIGKTTTVAGSGAYDTQALKREWLHEWQDLMEQNYAGFLESDDAELHWYDEQELRQRILEIGPEGTWLRLALLEAMLFEPYYPLGTEINKKGQEIPSKKYDELKGPLKGFKQDDGDTYLQELTYGFLAMGYVERLRSSYDDVLRNLSGSSQSQLASGVVGTVAAVAITAVVAVFAPQIAVALVGSSFSGLSGAALTSACLAYLGGGAVAAGGAGMAGGTAVIVGGGALVGVGAGAAAGGATNGISTAVNMQDAGRTTTESAKLIVAMCEIFLNDEGDVPFAHYLCDQYTQEKRMAEHQHIDLQYELEKTSKMEDGPTKKERKELLAESQKGIDTLDKAQKNMRRYLSSYETGQDADKGLPDGGGDSKRLPKGRSNDDSKRLPKGSDDDDDGGKGFLSRFGF